MKQGAVLQGRLNLAVDVAFDKFAGWRGLIAHANLFAIHGWSVAFQPSELSGDERDRGAAGRSAVRAYLEQKFLRDKWSIRFGQFAADSEFLATKYTDVFTNASLGWPAITSFDLPSRWPSPPLAAKEGTSSPSSGSMAWLTTRAVASAFFCAHPQAQATAA